MKVTKRYLNLIAGAVALVWATGSMALTLGPDDADTMSNENSALNATDVANIFGTSDLTLLYKQDFGGGESGSYADFYTTSFGDLDEDNEPHSALITWDGPDYIICPECYLVVKDGDEPQYLFNLATWNGQDVLDLQGFYPNKGAISHVAIFGKSVPVQVPEPGTLGLLGLGILGMLTIRRKLQKPA